MITSSNIANQISRKRLQNKYYITITHLELVIRTKHLAYGLFEHRSNK